MLDPAKFCPAPFVRATCRTNGTMNPCCYYIRTDSDLKKSSIRNEWNSISMTDLRATMLDGSKTDAQCKKHCYDKEQKNLPHERWTFLHNLGFTESDNYAQHFEDLKLAGNVFPTEIEFHVGNLCNLKCLTCDHRDSSSFLSESQMISKKYPNNISFQQYKHIKQSDYQYSDEYLADLMDEVLNNDIELLDLRGGETMMIPFIAEKLLDLPDQIRQKMRIRIQTNGTMLDDKWKLILDSYKNITMQFSIDAIGTDIHYVRYPADWDTIETNLKYVREKANVDLRLACAVSNLNLPILTRYMDWAENEGYHWNLNLVVTPAIFQANNLPEPLLRASQEKIEKLTRANEAQRKILDHLCALEPLNDQTLWSQFCQTISVRDEFRNNSIFDIHPYFKDYWVY